MVSYDEAHSNYCDFKSDRSETFKVFHHTQVGLKLSEVRSTKSEPSFRSLLNLAFMWRCFIHSSWRPSFYVMLLCFLLCFYVFALLTWLFNRVSLLFFTACLLRHLGSILNPTGILEKNHSLPSKVLIFYGFITFHVETNSFFRTAGI